MGFVFGQFELLKRLASGGMGEVFLARRLGVEGFEKLTVIKTLLPHLIESQEFLDMFLDEARLAARLDHPNICQIFELGELSGTYFIAMEYIAGVDLKDLQEDCRKINVRIPIPLACRIASDAAAALHYSHELTDNEGNLLGLVHRDVSPQNIIVTYSGGVKLIDFGVAKARNRVTHTTTGAVKGKFGYMPPEQAWGKDVDRRADIFSLGIVLHEMLTRKALFKADTEVATIKAVSDCNVWPPSSVDSAIPQSLDPVVLRALAPEPQGRYPTAEAFRHELENWMVQNQTQSSSAHLGTFMGALYKKRITAAKTKGPLWFVDLQAPVDPPKGFTPTQPGVEAAAGGKKSSLPLILGIVAAVIILGGVGAFFALKPDAAAQQTKQVATARPKLSVVTDPPGVSVTLDGTVLGMTPIKAHEVNRAKSAVLELSAPGLVTRTETVALEADLSLSYTMKKAMVTLRIESTPDGATVTIGDKEIGTTPLEWQAAPKESLELQFALKGYQDATKKVLAADGLTVTQALKKKGKKKEYIPTF